VFKKRSVYVTAEVLFQRNDSNPPVGTFICEWQETAAIPFFHRHLPPHGNTRPGRDHGHDGKWSGRFRKPRWNAGGPLLRPPGVFSRKQWPSLSMASRFLNEVIEHEAWFIELLAHKRDGKSIPSGHFRRGEPGHAPYSKNAGFYNP
jgi:hypothetical protein